VRAALCRAYGPPETVTVEDVEVPPLGSGQVRVKVSAAAINFPDVLVIAGTYQIKVPPPFVPGSELAGEVVEVAPGVTEIAPGDHVFGSTMVGAFGEEAVIDARALTRVPPHVDDRVAAGFGVAHRTAMHVLRSVARVREGDEVVVLGAGGGVGLATVQLAAWMGATVTAIASTADKLAVTRTMGAARTVASGDGELRAQLREVLPDGADVVVDPVGGDLSEPAMRALRWGGRFVTVGYASGTIPRIPLNLVLLKGIQVLGFQMIDFASHAPDEMARNEQDLLQLLSQGVAAPHIGAEFALDDVAAALRHVADGNAIGKVILDVARSTA
jgi:NADPH2:quinone reductase